MLNALIIDDEVLGAQALEALLKMYCPDVRVSGIAHSVDEAEKKIFELNPDLIFLDIEMPYADGFELLSRLAPALHIGAKGYSFDVIFTTAYNEYAIKAIKHNALDYLLKPVDPDELMAAVKKATDRKNKVGISGHTDNSRDFASLQKMISNLTQPQKVHKLPVPCSEGIVYLDPDNIVFLEGDLNYTHIHLIQGQKITSSRNLKEFAQLLPPQQFFRIHKAHIINLAYVKKYIKGDGGEIVMADGSTLDVSRLRKAELLAMLTV